MTITFQERERAFEAKFAHDEEFRYLVRARRDRLFAEWAAGKVAMPEAEAAELVDAVLHIPDGRRADGLDHDQVVMARVAEALALHRHGMTLPELAAVLERCAIQARDERLALPLDHPDAVF
jgi:hypothetical protein